jgi:hypothetical protein
MKKRFEHVVVLSSHEHGILAGYAVSHGLMMDAALQDIVSRGLAAVYLEGRAMAAAESGAASGVRHAH